MKATAKKLGVNMKKLATDINSEEIANKIKRDASEASEFGMQGTPGFLLNGVPIRGAYPLSQFQKIVEELQKRGKISL